MGEKESPLERFEASMAIGYEEWHDGIGYDIGAIAAASPAERAAIEAMLVPRAAQDWRDVEALAALDSPAARAALLHALERGGAEIRVAVLRHAPNLVADEQRTRTLVDAIETAVIYGGLTQTLREVAEFHPPEVVDALLRGALERDADVAVHLAAMLFFVAGLTSEEFDLAERPFFLRFATLDRAAREAAFVDLCVRIGTDPQPYLDDRT